MIKILGNKMPDKALAYISGYILFLFLLAGIADAAITIDSADASYNLGETAEIKFTLSGHDDFEGVAKLALSCDNYNIDYYSAIVELINSATKQFTAPPIRLIDKMKGNCKFTVELTSFDMAVTEKAESNSFKITDELGLQITYDDTTYEPGSKITIHGTIGADYEFTGGKAVITLGKEFTEAISEKEFSITITIPEAIKSFTNELAVAVADNYGNTGTYKGNVGIKQMPTGILLDFNKDSYNPGEAVNLLVKYVDQSNESIDEAVAYEIYGVKGFISRDRIAEGTVKNQLLMFQLSEFAAPGEYLVSVKAGRIKKEALFTVNQHKELEMHFEGENLVVNNIGNVPYNDELSIKNANGGDTLAVKINLYPNETTTINLAKKMGLPPNEEVTLNIDSAGTIKTLTTKLDNGKNEGLFSVTGAVAFLSQGGSKIISSLILIAIVVLTIVLIKRRGENKSDDGDYFRIENEQDSKMLNKLKSMAMREMVNREVAKSKDAAKKKMEDRAAKGQKWQSWQQNKPQAGQQQAAKQQTAKQGWAAKQQGISQQPKQPGADDEIIEVDPRTGR